MAQERSPRFPELSIFFFSADATDNGGDRYRLVLDAARMADEVGFRAVWLPERHFHPFGGLYPNPSVLAAALSSITSRLRLHAGSVVLPLHDPLRVAEEWSVVDNLSNGRVGISIASGFHPNDFVLAPEDYARRRELMLERLADVQRLWRGESLHRRAPHGDTEVRIYPQPLQPELPVWVTARETPATFELAGRLGANVFTALLAQSTSQLRERIELYRAARAAHGHDPDAGTVTLMLHAYAGPTAESVRAAVEGPLAAYLRTNLDLARAMAAGLGDADEVRRLQANEDALVRFGLKRYLRGSSLLGTPEHCRATLLEFGAAGVDEVACLLDFGVDPRGVLESLRLLADAAS